MLALPTSDYLKEFNVRVNPQGVIEISNKRPPEVNTAPPQTPTTQPTFNIDFDKLSQLFNDPRATPAFYKMALGMLTDLLSHQRGMEQLALQRRQVEALAGQRDITPLLNYANFIDKHVSEMTEKYMSIPDKNSPMALRLASVLNNLIDTRNKVHAHISTLYGLPTAEIPKLNTEEPKRKSSFETPFIFNLFNPASLALPEYPVGNLQSYQDQQFSALPD